MYYVAMRFTLILFVSILVSSCSEVYIKGPLDIESDHIKEIEGVWDGGEKGGIILIKNYGKNKVRVAFLDGKGGDDEFSFDFFQGDIVLRHDIFSKTPRPLVGGLLFFPEEIFDEDEAVDEDEDKIFFMRYFLSDNSIIIWMPDPTYFADLVESGEIAGKGNGKSIFLDIEASELISRIKEDLLSEQPSAFHTDDDYVIYRKIATWPEEPEE